MNLITHPLAAILTQDCDLENDYGMRFENPSSGSMIPAILFCEVASAQELRGQHDEINSRTWNEVRNNKNERYQFLRNVPAKNDLTNEGTPDLALDFKRFFTISTDEVYRRLELAEMQRRTRLVAPYREHLSTRFFFYHYRIALPEQHYVKPMQP